MIAAILTLFALIFIVFRMFRKEDDGREVSRAELATEIQKFIDGSATPLDWDGFVTFSLKDVGLENIRQECLDVLLEPKTKKEKPWLSDEALHTLSSAITRLQSEPEHHSTTRFARG